MYQIIAHNSEFALKIVDAVTISLITIVFAFEVFIIVRYLIPLRIKSPYILLFYLILTIQLLSYGMYVAIRLYNGDPGFDVNWKGAISIANIFRHISSTSYLILGFILSAIMFQLSTSLALILNIIDLHEAN